MGHQPHLGIEALNEERRRTELWRDLAADWYGVRTEEIARLQRVLDTHRARPGEELDERTRALLGGIAAHLDSCRQVKLRTPLELRTELLQERAR